MWPAAQLHMFGSRATGLALPGSDVDLVILGATPELRNAAQGFPECASPLGSSSHIWFST